LLLLKERIETREGSLWTETAVAFYARAIFLTEIELIRLFSSNAGAIPPFCNEILERMLCVVKVDFGPCFFFSRRVATSLGFSLNR
jgi:hypothetical protein